MRGGARTVSAMLLALSLSAPAHSQGRTDVVTLRNGDRITGEVLRLERGKLELKTDDAGTIYVEWDKLAGVVAARVVEVVTTDGRRFLGSLGSAADGSIAVVTPAGAVSLAMAEVTSITPIGKSFWRKLDGAVDAGFNYTRSSGVAQLNFNSDTIYRRPAFQGRLTASLTLIQKDDDSARDDRAAVEASYLHYRWQRWFIVAAARFETNESLGLELRSQIGAAVGPRLINSNRAQLALGAGLAFNDERGVDVEPTQNIEGLFLFSASFFTYDRPTTSLDARLQYYPSLSSVGRYRVQLDAGVRQEMWKDFFGALSLYNTFDSRPPNAAADRNDIGLVLSLGWTY